MLDVRFLNQLTATDENSKANHVPVIHFQKCEHRVDFSFYAVIPLQMAIFTAISAYNKLAILLIKLHQDFELWSLPSQMKF